MISIKTVEFFDRVVPLSQCVLGTVIAVCDLTKKTDKSKYSYYHLAGFSKNSQGELILALQYFGTDSESTKNVTFVHPANCCIQDY